MVRVDIYNSDDRARECCAYALIGGAVIWYLGGCGVQQNPEPEERENKSLLINQIENYQKNISPKLREKLGDNICKYEPSCSEYAKQAIEKHGSLKGSIMAASRLARCNPWSKGGEDQIS